MIIIRKSQSALLCPLTVRTHEDTLVGSLELFRFNSQPFDPEFEARMRVFVEHFSNVLQVYLSIRQTRTQVRTWLNHLFLAPATSAAISSNMHGADKSHFTAPTFAECDSLGFECSPCALLDSERRAGLLLSVQRQLHLQLQVFWYFHWRGYWLPMRSGADLHLKSEP